MQWIYILKCENDSYYIGQTSRLYRRFWEHEDGRGGVNTSINRLIEIVAIYKASDIGKFLLFKNSLLKILLAYLLPSSHKIVTIVLPLPSFFASFTAPAIFIPDEPPKIIFCFSKNFTVYSSV